MPNIVVVNHNDSAGMRQHVTNALELLEELVPEDYRTPYVFAALVKLFATKTILQGDGSPAGMPFALPAGIDLGGGSH